MTYQEALDTMYSRLPFFQNQGKTAYKADLSRTIEMLNRLENPHENIKTVHIAGTNGKGTSAHILASILQSAGYKVGLYTSPHLKSFRERIRINGVEISESRIVDFVEQLDILIGNLSPSFFEMTVVMGFQYFFESGVDIAVIETGLGGRLDSTNVISPEVSLITTIGMDHTDILGDTIQEIASEKAGIIKENVPVVLSSAQPDLFPIFEKKVNDIGSRINKKSWDYSLIAKSEFDLIVDGENHQYEINPEIKANYFLKNVPGVIEVIKELALIGWHINDSHVVQGINRVVSNTGLKGRFQVLAQSPTVIADVSHNPDGLAELFDQISLMEYSSLHVVFGTVRDKNVKSLRKILPHDAKYYITQSNTPRSMLAEELQHHLELPEAKTFDDVNEALESAFLSSEEDDLILVTGSTFVVAELKNL